MTRRQQTGQKNEGRRRRTDGRTNKIETGRQHSDWTTKTYETILGRVEYSQKFVRSDEKGFFEVETKEPGVVEIHSATPDWTLILKDLELFLRNLPFCVHAYDVGLPLKGDYTAIGFVITPKTEQYTEFLATNWIEGLPRQVTVSDGSAIPIYVESPTLPLSLGVSVING